MTDEQMHILREWFDHWPRVSPWFTVAAINPENGTIHTKSFGWDEGDQFAPWVKDHSNQGWNLYFSPNPPTVKDKKPGKEEIESIRFLWVDCDPLPGETVPAALARILARVKATTVPPSYVVKSGRGYQLYWQLSEPLTDKALADRYLRRPRDDWAGDPGSAECAHIMRLPGPTNHPNEAKRAKGYTEPTPTDFFYQDIATGGHYPLKLFSPAQEGAKAKVAVEIKVDTANIRRVKDLDTDERVRALRNDDDGLKCLAVVNLGEDPIYPKGHPQSPFPSDSEAVWFVVNSMLRHDCSDQTIFEIITDPDHKISAHVLRQKANPNDYAIKQIAKAKEKATAIASGAIIMAPGDRRKVLDQVNVAFAQKDVNLYQRGPFLVYVREVCEDSPDTDDLRFYKGCQIIERSDAYQTALEMQAAAKFFQPGKNGALGRPADVPVELAKFYIKMKQYAVRPLLSTTALFWLKIL